MFNLQAMFANDRAVIYRSYGDALAWSGRPDAATHVFERGLREGLSPHGPHCRPAKARPVVGIPLHIQPARALFPHVALKLESALEVMQREFDGIDYGNQGGFRRLGARKRRAAQSWLDWRVTRAPAHRQRSAAEARLYAHAAAAHVCGVDVTAICALPRGRAGECCACELGSLYICDAFS
jgi:hypothetical protein